MLNFEGLRDVRAKERVQNRLLTHIKEASEEMARGDLSNAFLFVALSSQPSLSSRSKRLREGGGGEGRDFARVEATSAQPSSTTGPREIF